MANIKVLVIGGGGGGAGFGGNSGGGGGGGAGGYTYDAAHTVGFSSYPVVVGTGGAGGDNNPGQKGLDSTFDTITSEGGGGGRYGNSASNYNGGSGGGGSNSNAGGTASAGNIGGAGVLNGAGGGGGGAGSAGTDASGTTGGDGGNGQSNDISGSSVIYGGGGGGGAITTAGFGGTGGGGNADNSSGIAPTTGGIGTDGLGGGGGGSRWNPGGRGGSGVVIVRYVTSELGSCTGGTITTDGTDTIHTFTASGTFTNASAILTFAVGENVVLTESQSSLSVGFSMNVSDSSAVSDLPFYYDNTFILWESVSINITGDRSVFAQDSSVVSDQPIMGEPYVPQLWTDESLSSTIWTELTPSS